LADEQITAKPPVPAPTDAIVASDAKIASADESVGRRGSVADHFDTLPDIAVPRDYYLVRLALVFLASAFVTSCVWGVHGSTMMLACVVASMGAFLVTLCFAIGISAKRFIDATRASPQAAVPNAKPTVTSTAPQGRQSFTASSSEAIRE